MAIAGLTIWSANQILTSTSLNTNFSTIRDHYNANAVELSGTQSITGVKTFSAQPVLAAGASVTADGITVTGGTITAAASVTGAASLNIPHGTAPSAPNNGDVWTTTAGVFARINGVTTTFPSGSGTNGKVTRWTASGTIADASLADNGTYITHAAQPRCFLDATTATSVGASATASLAFPDPDIIDVGAMHDTSSNNTRITVPAGAGGLYVVHGHIVFGAASTNGQVTLNLRKNGTTNLLINDVSSFANGTETVTIPFNAAATLSAADYIEIRVTNSGSQTINVRGTIVAEGRWCA